MKFLFVLAALVGSASAQCVGLPTMAYTPTTAPTDDGAGNYAAGQVFEVVLNSACASGFWGATGATTATTTATCTAGQTDAWVWDNGDPTGCAALTVCTATEYESTAATATSDRACTALTVCGTAEKETVAPTATANRVCGWKTCADVNADSRVRGADGEADVNADNTAVTVDSTPTPSCLCGANQEGVMSVLPNTMDMAPAPAACVDLAAGVVEHEMMVTVTLNAALADYETSQTNFNAGFATPLWLISGLEAAHVKFEGAAATEANTATQTDVTFKLVFASKTWAETAKLAIAAADLAIADRTVANQPAQWATGDITEVVLDGAARSGVALAAAAAVATALLL